MSAPARLAAFAAALAVLFGAGALAGAAVDPDRGEQGAQGGVTEARTDGERPVPTVALTQEAE